MALRQPSSMSDGLQCFLTCALEMIHFSVPRVEAPQVFEDECEVSFLFLSATWAIVFPIQIMDVTIFTLLLANNVRFTWSANSAFTQCSGSCNFPRIVANVPLPNAVYFDFTIQFQLDPSSNQTTKVLQFEHARRAVNSSARGCHNQQAWQRHLPVIIFFWSPICLHERLDYINLCIHKCPTVVKVSLCTYARAVYQKEI